MFPARRPPMPNGQAFSARTQKESNKFSLRCVHAGTDRLCLNQNPICNEIKCFLFVVEIFFRFVTKRTKELRSTEKKKRVGNKKTIFQYIQQRRNGVQIEHLVQLPIRPFLTWSNDVQQDSSAKGYRITKRANSTYSPRALKHILGLERRYFKRVIYLS